MTPVRRLKAVTALLGVAAVITCSHVWGEPAAKNGKTFSNAGRPEAPKVDRNLIDDLANTKFTNKSLVLYKTLEGETLFALQLQPKLNASVARPHDLLIMVDTSASQAYRGPESRTTALQATRKLVDEVIKAAKPGDRVALMTVNTVKASLDLTRGFEAAGSAKLTGALNVLAQEPPYGANDLKAALDKAIASFDNREGRQRAIVFFGSGKSLLNPITNPERHELCAKMIGKEIAFFSVPMGANLEPVNLHGLATGTGGKLIRALSQETPVASAKKLTDAVAAPILYTSKFQLAADEIYPTKLPPLRGDAPTLVVGKVKPAAQLAYTVEGTVAGKKVAIPAKLDMPVPEVDNFFLVRMLNEWKSNDQRERPWPFQAERGLVLAYERSRLARDEFKAQGEWAVEMDRLDVAGQMFAEARKIDPNDAEADAGMKIVDKLKRGLLDKDRLNDAIGKPEDPALRFRKGGAKGGLRDRMDKLVAFAQAEDKMDAPAPKLPAANNDFPPDREPLLRRQQALQAVEEQRISGVVSRAERQATQILQNDPEAAHDLLKRTLASVRDNADLAPQTRQRLVNQLEARLRDVDSRAVRIKRDLDERMKNEAMYRERIAAIETRERNDEQLMRRVQAFNHLMNTGRYEEAQLAAMNLQADRIASGLPIGPVETASLAMGTNSIHIKEQQEIRRATEERFLLTMLQVDKSHIPFPDEPPVGFPPAAIWRKLTDRRKGLYDSVGLGEDAAGRASAQKIKDKLATPVNLDKGIDPNTPLKDALDFLADRYDLTLIIDTKAFEAQNVQKVEEQPVSLPKMVGVSLATVMRLMLSQIKADAGYYGTYMVRRDFIEITTTYNAAAEKVVRAFPVADLVISIPNSVNQNALQSSLQTFGQFQQPQPPLGAMPGLPAGGGFAGIPPVGNMGMGMGMGNNPAFNALGNNQYGNLGGQFGLQGTDTSRKLMELIVKVVAPGEWYPLGIDPNSPLAQMQIGGGGAGGLGAPDPLNMEPTVGRELLNSIDYYETARSLVVRGSSRLHARLEGGVLTGGKAGPPGEFLPGKANRDGVLVFGPRGKDDPKSTKGAVKPVIKPAEAVAKAAEIDPKKVWEDALAEMLKNPEMDHTGRVIACADFLVEHKKFNHAAEFLKAELRLGIVARPWVYEALSVALQLAGGSPDEIERAQVSAVDLEPQDAKGYLKAAKAMNELGRKAQAVAFCKQAAIMEPNRADSFANALVYAHDAGDIQAVAWAASNLLKQDWPLENEDLHNKAKTQVNDLVRQLEQKSRKADASQLLATVRELKGRDLVIKLNWQGNADFDLKVKEPIGTVCSYLQKQTPGGGTLLNDDLTKLNDDQSNTPKKQYVAAEGYSGDYEITVERVYGAVAGAKVTVEVIRHQGTAKERVEYHKLILDRSNKLTVKLADGRRQTVASVPPPAAVQESVREGKTADPNLVLNKLRTLSETGIMEVSGMRGGVTSTGRTPRSRTVRSVTTEPTADAKAMTYKDVQGFVNTAINITSRSKVQSPSVMPGGF